MFYPVVVLYLGLGGGGGVHVLCFLQLFALQWSLNQTLAIDMSLGMIVTGRA